MITGRDVAERAGTSTAVVSYVFNNGPRNVSPATRQRVLDAAAELNYRPNVVAKALSAGRTASIGLIVPDIANSYFGELARAIEDAALDRDNLLLIGDSAMNAEQERLHMASFVDRRVDAVILVSLLDEPDISLFQQAGLPVVVLHPIDETKNVSSLTIDYEKAAHSATAHLLAHGYPSIGLLNGPGDSAGSRQHLRGFTQAMEEAGRPVTHVRSSSISRADAAETALAWLRESEHPRALYATTDEQAFGVLYAAYECGLSVPGDLAVVGFDGTAHSGFAVPPLATVKQPVAAIADRAMTLLVDLGGEETVHELFDFEFVPRASCGC
ncbi:LacI family DNA-binding transcriptional regulator [Leifsonia poae]|uniref:LacI family DNA-binding transcriptional regulator n=1 Tax=Leifsonia poae TaxID=110933 RepID=UPI001CC012BE|nr:LacI family DNA-binding transcriptional regulator [Leifsonia poae]